MTKPTTFLSFEQRNDVIRKAHAERSEMMTYVLRQLFSWPSRLLSRFSKRRGELSVGRNTAAPRP